MEREKRAAALPKADKFAALRLAREGGSRAKQWKACDIVKHTAQATNASESTHRRRRMRTSTMRSTRIHTRASSVVDFSETISSRTMTAAAMLIMGWTYSTMKTSTLWMRTARKIAEVSAGGLCIRRLLTRPNCRQKEEVHEDIQTGQAYTQEASSCSQRVYVCGLS